MPQKVVFGAILFGWMKSHPCMSAWDFVPSKLQVSSLLSLQTTKATIRLKENREISGWIYYSESVQNKAPWLRPDTYSTSGKGQMNKKEVPIKYDGNSSLTLWLRTHAQFPEVPFEFQDQRPFYSIEHLYQFFQKYQFVSGGSLAQ